MISLICFSFHLQIVLRNFKDGRFENFLVTRRYLCNDESNYNITVKDIYSQLEAV